MRINDLKIQELKNTATERALNEGYILATKGIRIEDLKVFEFANGEKDYIIADNLDNAIGFYIEMVGKEEAKEYEINEIKDWYNVLLKEEQDEGGFINTTFLQAVKEHYKNGYLNPTYIASTCKG